MPKASTSLRQPNLHTLLLLLRSEMPPLAFHIRLDPRFLILEPLIIFMIIRIFFSSLTITSHLPMIILANRSQTMAKRIGSACPLPSIPLTFVLYVPDSPFNLISISKLTRDLTVKRPTLLKAQACRFWVYYEYHSFNTLPHVRPYTPTWRV